MNRYEWKQEQRRERLERAAARATDDGNARLTGARRHIEGIPFGQPILVGHHSEGRHRAALRKFDRGMSAGFARLKEAEELARRAAAIGHAGISSDDPDAVEKLGDKLETLEAKRDRMKAINAAYRKRDEAKLLELTGLTLEAWDAEVAKRYSWEKQPFAPYQLTNLGARIRASKKRVEQLSREAPPAPAPETIGTLEISVDVDELRVVIKSAARLSTTGYKAVRSAGFVWARTRGAFVRKYNPATLAGILYGARHAATNILNMES